MRLVLLALIAACSWAQLRVEIRSYSGPATDRLKEAERHLLRAQQVTWRDIRAPEERAVVETDAGLCREYFQPPISSDPRIATLTEGGKDVLVARWAGPGDQSAFSELTLWDTPEAASFIFRLPRGSWSSDADIRAAFERLLQPAGSDKRKPLVNSVTLEVAKYPQTQRRFGDGGLMVNIIPRSFDVGPPNWLDFWETPSASYLSATLNIRYVRNSYDGARLIEERFPPLETRVGQWSKKRLLDELSRGRLPARDRILAVELVKRDPTEEELLAVFASRWIFENGALLQAVVDAGQTSRYAGAIRKYLLTYRWTGERRAYANPDPFKAVSAAGDANFPDATLAQLRQAASAYNSFIRAAAHGATPADYRALKEQPCPDDALTPACGRALREMRKRLGLDADGNPLTAK
jgi:hypothetical protein